MLRLGYGSLSNNSGQVLGRSGDEGIDGVISLDTLGLDKVYLQAKKYTGASVGSPAIREFKGALDGQRASKGVFITTSQFSKEARETAKSATNYVIKLYRWCRVGEINDRVRPWSLDDKAI